MKNFYLFKKMIMPFFFVFLSLVSFHLFAEGKNKNDEVTAVNWTLNDDTPANGWDFSEVWQQNKDKIRTADGFNYIRISSKETISNRFSLEIPVEHYENGYIGCSVFCSTDNSGFPPKNIREANAGKDISVCDTLRFYVKISTKQKNINFKIQLMDKNDKMSDKLFLSDYLHPDNTWQPVLIPMDEFSQQSGIDLKNIKAVRFIIEPDDPQGVFTIYINSIGFVKMKRVLLKRFKLVFNDNTASDGAWNFSGAVVGNGTVIKTSPYYNNLAIDMKEKYKGNSSLHIEVLQQRLGWGFFYFTGCKDGSGSPAGDWNDYDTPKDISIYNALQFWIKGSGVCCGKVELSDTDKNNSGKFPLLKDLKLPRQWKKIIIPYDEIPWQIFNTYKFKDMKIIFDSDHPPADINIYLDNIEFIRLPD